MKKFFSLLLSMVMIITVTLNLNLNAYAAGWLSEAVNLKLNVWYNESYDVTDWQSPESGRYSEVFKVSVPAKGTINMKITSDNKWYTGYSEGIFEPDIYYLIYKNSDTSNSIYCEDVNYGGYDSSIGEYHASNKVNLSKGTYYIRIVYEKLACEKGIFTGSYDFSFVYRPSFANTAITKLTKQKKAFNVKWKKASGATGYQIQYSLKKNLKGAKTIKIAKNSTTSRKVKKLKGKKTYYVRVRTYRIVKVNGKNKAYFGKWSAKKSVKTK